MSIRSLEISLSLFEHKLFGPRARKREIPAESSVLELNPVKTVMPDEVNPVRAMQEETGQLYNSSAALVRRMVGTFPVESDQGADGMVIFNSPISLSVLTSREIFDFLTFERNRCNDPVVGIRGREMPTKGQGLVLEVFVSERSMVMDEQARSFVRVNISPTSIQLGAWSSEDHVSNKAQVLIQEIRKSVSADTKAERDYATYYTGLSMYNFAATFIG
jgi:hypothetical protein